MQTGAFLSEIRRWTREEAVFVFTMGKVGSTALETHLHPAVHTHSLYGNPVCPPAQRYKYGRLGACLQRSLLQPLKRFGLRRRAHIRIVTFYRDPKERNPAMFMQDLPFWLTAYIARYKPAMRCEDPDFLVSAYKEIFPHDFPMIWVRDELARFTGIAPDELMLGEADHRILRRGRYSVFLGRSEALDRCRGALAEFLDRPEFGEVDSANRGNNKWYGPLYAAFLESLRRRDDIPYAEAFRRANGYQG